MPPKRRRPAADEEAEGEAGKSDMTKNLRLSARSTAVPGKRSQLTPLAAKHTTSYGSPAPVLPTQGQGGYGSDLKAATRDIFAAVRRDQKRAKLSHETSEQPEQRGVSSRPGRRSGRTSREPSVQESIRAATPEVIEDEEEEEGDPWLAAGAEGASSATAALAPAQQQASDDIAAELRRLQARREAREAEERKEKERADREERERARKEEKERADRERAERERTNRERAERERAETERLQQQQEQERIDKEQRQRARREEKERADREREERKQRERQEREERERSRQEARERAERAEREHRERVEREETERAEREARERTEREAKERAEEEEQQRLEQEREDREYRELQEAEQAMRAQTDQQRDAQRAEADRKRAETAARGQADVQGLIARSKRLQEEEDAALDRRRLPGPHPNLRQQFSSQVPQKRDGQEFLDDLFISPKRPRNNDQTPTAAYLRGSGRRFGSQPPDSAAMSTRSFIEESSVFRDADLRTPGASSTMGDTPSRLPVPGNAAPRAPSLGPVAGDQRLPMIAQIAAQRNRQAQDGRAAGPDQQPAPSRPDFAPRPAPNQPAFPPQPQPVSANPLPPQRQPDLRPRPVSSNPPPAPGGSGFLPRPNQPTRVGPGPPRFPPAPESDEEPEEPEAGPSRTPRRSSRLSRTKNTPKPDPAPERRDPAPRPPPRPPVEDEPRRPDRDSSSDPSSPSDDGGKGGPRPPRKQNTLRLRRDQNRPVRDGAPPGDDPPPDDDSFAAQFKKTWKDWKHYLWLILRWLGYFLLIVAVSRLIMMYMLSRVGSSSWENNGGSYGVEWYGWNHMGHNIGQFVPYDLRHPLGFLNDAEYNSLRDHINTQDRRIFKLTDQNNDLQQTTQKLESILPKIVSVQQDKKTSKLVIGQDFWHALKDLIHKEKSILTLDRGKDGKNNISEEHWVAVLQRLKNEGVLSKKEVDGIVNSAVSTSWENWLKNNMGKVDKVLPGSSGQPLSADAEKKLLKQLDKLVREKVSGPGLRDIVVTRDEFIREIQNYMRAHKREADASLAQVQDALKDMIAAAKHAASQTGGMYRDEVVTLTNDLIQKAISNARLEGTAKGTINSNLRHLSRRINYFAIGNGATIDVSFTSPSYESPAFKKPPSFFGTDAWLKAVATSPRFIPEQAAALSTWEEAGHCWCAGANQPSNPAPQPADINIRLARPVVPTNIVMEHIDPAATLDPLAMPKDMEVWVMMDDPERLVKAKDFMFSQFPDTARDHPLLAKWYVKIGEFRYEHDPAVGGVRDYQVNEEWGKLGIATDLVLVRATSNYGADHTCFYRVRLYGNEVERGETEE